MSFETILKTIKCETYYDKSFKDITTFKIGGKIAYLAYPNSIKSFLKIIKLCKKYQKKYIILGAGSNVLAGDDFFDGIVVCTKKLNNIKIKSNKIFAECGLSLGALVLNAQKKCLSNMEWAIGIPGTVGGACFMNAEAFDFQTFDYIEYVLIFDGKRVKKLYKKDIEFGYRFSGFQKNGQIILGACFLFLQKSNNEIAKKIDFFIKKRAISQKIGYANAGSVFKKPQKDLSASKLIDMAGLKGQKFGNAMVSTVHAGFVVNLGNANFKDVKKLIDFILEKVYNIFNINLELEVVLINQKEEKEDGL